MFSNEIEVFSKGIFDQLSINVCMTIFESLKEPDKDDDSRLSWELIKNRKASDDQLRSHLSFRLLQLNLERFIVTIFGNGLFEAIAEVDCDCPVRDRKGKYKLICEKHRYYDSKLHEFMKSIKTPEQITFIMEMFKLTKQFSYHIHYDE